MNQLENRQARYRSNTWMGRTRTDGPDEFELSKFDCIYFICENTHKVWYKKVFAAYIMTKSNSIQDKKCDFHNHDK